MDAFRFVLAEPRLLSRAYADSPQYHGEIWLVHADSASRETDFIGQTRGLRMIKNALVATNAGA